MPEQKTVVGKTQKFDLSTIRIPARENEVATRLRNLEPGEGFVVLGRERADILTGVRDLHNIGWRYTTKKIGVLQYQVVRLK